MSGLVVTPLTVASSIQET